MLTSTFPLRIDRRIRFSFWKKLVQFLLEMDASNLITGGDFNSIMNPYLDKNNNTPSQAFAETIRNKIHMLKEEWALSDVWRIRNPLKRG